MMSKLKKALSFILFFVIAVSLISNSFAMTASDADNIKILGVKSNLGKSIPKVSVKEGNYSRVLESKYIPLSNKAFFVSSENNEKMLIRMSAKLQSRPSAIVGYNQKDRYIEYLPYNYDAKQQTVEFTADNNMVIIPVKNNLIFKNVAENRIGIQAISTSDKNFNIVSNYNGNVSVNIQTLYNSSDKFYYKVYKENTLVKAKTYITSPNFSTSFSIRGVYRFELFKQNSFWLDTKLWEQEAYVEPNALSTSVKSTLNGLANQYAPILIMSQNESYKPIQLTDIFSNSSYKIALNTKNGTSKFTLPAIKNYMRYNGYSKALFEGHWGLGTISDSLEDLPISTYEPHIYYSYCATNTNYIINYHFFYSFDPKTPSTSITAHNFDREQISITFNKTTLQPENIYFPQHLMNSVMGLRSDSGSAINNVQKDSNTLTDTWTGYVKMAFSLAKNNNMVYENSHPIIAIAEGSHAPYPLSGIYMINGSNEPAGMTDSTINKNCFLIPSGVYNEKVNTSSFTSKNSYNLSALQIDNITSGGTNCNSVNLLAFSGDWVDIVGLDNEKFPPLIDIMRNVEKYIDESMKSNKHTFTMTNIPSSIISRTDNIKKYLDDNLNH